MNEGLKKVQLNLREAKIAGGQSQIEFIPLNDEPLGLRVYKNTEFPQTDSTIEMIDGLGKNVRLNWAIGDALLSLNLPEEVQAVTPKLAGLGLYIPDGEGSFYFEVDRQIMQGQGIYEALSFICQEGVSLARKGIKSNIFSLVEKVPFGRFDDVSPDLFYQPQELARKDPKAYILGLISALRFYREAENLGMWSYDIQNKSPFFCDRQGNVRVIDTSGFKFLRQSRAEVLLEGFYEQEMARLEPAIRAELIGSEPDPLTPEEWETYRNIAEQIEGLKAERQESLSALEIFSGSEVILQLKEKNLDLEDAARSVEEQKLDELDARIAKAHRERDRQAQAAEIEGRVSATEKKGRDAKLQLRRLSGLEEFKQLADGAITSGAERLDEETFRKLVDLRWNVTQLIKSLPRRGFVDVAFCRDVLTEIEALEVEKPLSKRKEEAQGRVEELDAELKALHEQREAIGEIPHHISEPTTREFEAQWDAIARLRSSEEIMALKEKIVRLRQVIEQIGNYNTLDIKVSLSQKQAARNTEAVIRGQKDKLPEHGLLQIYAGAPTANDIANLLKESGFERFLDATDSAELKASYENLRSGRFLSDTPKAILNNLIAQLERVSLAG
ncbi:MAG TPA: hypothetical protein VMW29_00635 [Candidatus Bathyarchaeia archaeon]|nr:hypothetical protein [Candidatus Bathyarchaeia archaeon]